MISGKLLNLRLIKVGIDKFWEERILLAAVLMLASFASLAFDSQVAKASPYSSYNCAAHCYGIITWTNNGNFTPVNGAQTTISVVGIACPPPSCSYSNVDFIDNEMWVIDRTHQASNCPKYGKCWVEGGYIAYPNSSSSYTEDYFWADYRPFVDSDLHFHDLGVVPSGDYGFYVVIYIYRVSSTSFRVHIYSVTKDFSNQYSTSNQMTPDDIEIGQELQGTHGASSGSANFVANQYVSTRDNNLHYQTNNGSPGTNPGPITSYWVVPPSQSSTGGDFLTKCGC